MACYSDDQLFFIISIHASFGSLAACFHFPEMGGKKKMEKKKSGKEASLQSNFNMTACKRVLHIAAPTALSIHIAGGGGGGDGYLA